MMTHYLVTAEICVTGNYYPQSRHTFLVEVDSEKVFIGKTAQGVFERAHMIEEAVSDATCDLLGAADLLTPPHAATVDVKLLRGGASPEKRPDRTAGGIKLWRVEQT